MVHAASHTVHSCRFIAPIEGVGLLTWWVVDQIISNPDTWWQITIDSLATVLLEWVVVLSIVIGLNWWLRPLVIHKPRNRILARILGCFLVLTPVLFTPPTPPLIHTPQVLTLCACMLFNVLAASLSFSYWILAQTRKTKLPCLKERHPQFSQWTRL